MAKIRTGNSEGNDPSKKKAKVSSVNGANPVQTDDAKEYYQNVVKNAFEDFSGRNLETHQTGPVKDQSRIEKNPNSPNYGKQVTDNTCVGYSCDLARRSGALSKQYEYNPDFTREHEQDGWVKIPIDSAQAGDRVQFWGAPKDVKERVKDLGKNQYIPGLVPTHMAVVRHYQNGNMHTYEDGSADKPVHVRQRQVSDKNATVYRYMGTPNSQKQFIDNLAEKTKAKLKANSEQGVKIE